MTTYSATEIGVTRVNGDFHKHLQLTTTINLQVGDTVLFSDGECLVYSKEEYPLRIKGKKCVVEAFVLENSNGKYIALARTTYKGRIQLAFA